MPFLLAKNAALALPIFYHCQRRKSFFFFLLATLLEVHYCVPRVLVLKGYCENCSKQNAQHQDARNRIQGWNYLPRVDVTAAPFNPGWYNSSSQLLDIAHSVMRRTKVAITEKPCCWRKQHQDVKKNFLSIRQLNNGSQLQIVGYSLNLYRHISTYCWGAAWLRQLRVDDNWEFGLQIETEILRVFQLAPLLFGRTCDVRLAKWFTFV